MKEKGNIGKCRAGREKITIRKTKEERKRGKIKRTKKSLMKNNNRWKKIKENWEGQEEEKKWLGLEKRKKRTEGKFNRTLFFSSFAMLDRQCEKIKENLGGEVQGKKKDQE